MYLRFLLLLNILLLSLACQQNKRSGKIGQLLGPEMQKYNIEIGIDTLLVCKNGTILHFCPNTFISAQKKIVLELQEVRDRGEAFLLGISTMASDGRLLETEGMFYLDASTKDGAVVTINPDCPIRIEIPVAGRRGGTSWFKGELSSTNIIWTETAEGLSNKAAIATLETGQQLFSSLCISCHCRDLVSPSTAPALGNITQFRTSQWLRDFTRNSQKMMEEGDTLALCLWAKYKPVMMNSFEQLTDNQIDAIYQFTEEESSRLKVPLDSTDYACSISSTVGSNYPGGHISLDDTFIVQALLRNPYIANIYNMGWYNCDIFVTDTSAIPASILVTIPDADQYEDLLVGILFDQLNTNIILTQEEVGQFTVYPYRPLLPRVKASIVAIGLNGKQWFRYTQPFQVDDHNEFTAEMAPVSLEAIKDFVKKESFKQPQIKLVQRACLQSQ